MDATPEETVAPAVAPATSERVTSDVPKTKLATAKYPGRVASGKRLDERNRLAREAKKNKPKHKKHLQPQRQTQVQQIRQNNQATTTQTLVTSFLGLAV